MLMCMSAYFVEKVCACVGACVYQYAHVFSVSVGVIVKKYTK